MYTDKWHLTFNLEYDMTRPNDPSNLLYLFTYAYPPNITRADCTNRRVHGHPRLKNGQFAKESDTSVPFSSDAQWDTPFLETNRKGAL